MDFPIDAHCLVLIRKKLSLKVLALVWQQSSPKLATFPDTIIRNQSCGSPVHLGSACAQQQQHCCFPTTEVYITQSHSHVFTAITTASTMHNTNNDQLVTLHCSAGSAKRTRREVFLIWSLNPAHLIEYRQKKNRHTAYELKYLHIT